MNKYYKFVISIFFLVILSGQQGNSDPNKGDVRYTQWGIMDGNAVRTLYSNHAEVARWPDQPSGEWPKGSGHSYVDGVALVISASTFDTLGNRIHPMSTNYREFIDIDPIEKTPWGWGPLPGYSNDRQSSPARSDDPFTWPDVWPDKPDWSGEWNGFFGRGIMNAEVETYFLCDDSPDKEWLYAHDETGAGVFYPDRNDSTRGGLGMEIKARGFQWGHVLAQDVIFWLYEVTNESTTDYDSVYFSQYIDWGIGGTDDSGDDEGGYNTFLDIAFAWDYNGLGQPGRWGPTGVASYAFLESPGNSYDGIDNDLDGLIDETRDNPPGNWIDSPPDHGVADPVKFYEFYKRMPRPHWQGDEDQDWYGFDDKNGNGIWDKDEPLNDDVGADGLAPYHPNYPGPDAGEGDGLPTDGEPNYNATDKDESDQLGLTGFNVFDVHDYELTDDERDWRDIFTTLAPPLSSVYLEGGRNLGMFFSSGPFPMPAGHTERFSMALIFAEKDFPDAPEADEIKNSSLARKKDIVQQIYNADYRFAQPPLKPNLTAIPGDGQVILYWDNRAEDSFDPFLKEYDFEGYKVYRSTEPFFNENRIITSTYGEKTFKQPLVQYDYNNDISGLHPVDILGVKYNLGTNTGLRHFFIDRDVINGRTYYYAVVSYDRGLVGRDSDGNIYIDDQGHARGLAPSECTSIINVDISQNIKTDINTAVVTPRSNAAGYVEGRITDVTRTWNELTAPATGYADLFVVQDDSLQNNHRYELLFISDSSYHDDPEPLFILSDITSDPAIILTDTIPLVEYGQELPIIHGLGFNLYNDNTVSIIDSLSGWREGSTSNYHVTVKELILGDNLWSEFGNRKKPYPADYIIVFEDDIADTSVKLNAYPGGPFAKPAIPVPFRIWNQTEQRYAKFGIVERIQPDTNAFDHIWQPTEPIMILIGDSAGVDPVPDEFNYKVAWVIRLFEPETESLTPIRPGAGDAITVTTTKPFRNGERIQFRVTGSTIDENQLKKDMKSIYVVPNPYVATSIFEPSNVYKSGRGERRIYFMNLPENCTISIYTKSGKLVKTLVHNGTNGNGQEPWDLVSKDGMNVAYGIYFYVVEAEHNQSLGKFAVIK
ncbi:MAG: hypothetical protein GXO90_05330 [FCB group bacterium]|nr:hypothetical protein [FCB group bacterium]